LIGEILKTSNKEADFSNTEVCLFGPAYLQLWEVEEADKLK